MLSFVSPQVLFRRLALAEMVTWALLILGLVLKYVTHTTELGVRIFGSIHGFVFLSYCAVVLLVWLNQRWTAGVGLLSLGSAIIPFATVPMEHHLDNTGKLEGPWRMQRGEQPAGLGDRILALAVRYPLPVAIVTVIGVAVVFSVLLMAGPPTQWFS